MQCEHARILPTPPSHGGFFLSRSTTYRYFPLPPASSRDLFCLTHFVSSNLFIPSGNALLRWLQEAGAGAAALVRAAAAISAPLDLAAAGAAIDRGLNRVLYARMFLRSMRRKAREKWARFPGLFDLERALAARTLRAFDDAFTAPLHGFRGVQDYWQRASSRPHLRAVRVPTLVLNARNDPFVPGASLPDATEAGPYVQLWQPARGGHVGFAEPRAPWDLRGDVAALPQRVMPWLAEAAGWLSQ